MGSLGMLFLVFLISMTLTLIFPSCSPAMPDYLLSFLQLILIPKLLQHISFGVNVQGRGTQDHRDGFCLGLANWNIAAHGWQG